MEEKIRESPALNLSALVRDQKQLLYQLREAVDTLEALTRDLGYKCPIDGKDRSEIDTPIPAAIDFNNSIVMELLDRIAALNQFFGEFICDTSKSNPSG